MSVPNPPANSRHDLDRVPLSLDRTYGCPVCRRGQLEAIVLMDAFGCGFCRNLFTVNLTQQTLILESSLQSVVWRWTGAKWQLLHQRDPDLTLLVWGVSTVLFVIPAGMIWLMAYLFPPLEGLSWTSFSVLWGDLTWGIHLTIGVWLLLEHYQPAAYVTAKYWLQQLRERVLDLRDLRSSGGRS